MSREILIDTGVLVAAIDRRDQFHQWATSELALLQPPLLTCEPVCTETFFLLQRVRGGQEAFITLLNRGLVQIPFHLDRHIEAVTELLNRYQSVPMSLADACLVKMVEEYESSSVMTLDSDFQIYRKNRNQPIPLITPGQG
jgi:predicted nucleic acid-binding protein